MHAETSTFLSWRKYGKQVRRERDVERLLNVKEKEGREREREREREKTWDCSMPKRRRERGRDWSMPKRRRRERRWGQQNAPAALSLVRAGRSSAPAAAAHLVKLTFDATVDVGDPVLVGQPSPTWVGIATLLALLGGRTTPRCTTAGGWWRVAFVVTRIAAVTVFFITALFFDPAGLLQLLRRRRHPSKLKQSRNIATAAKKFKETHRSETPKAPAIIDGVLIAFIHVL